MISSSPQVQEQQGTSQSLLRLLPLSGRHGIEVNAAARAGQLRPGRARRDAGNALGRDAMHLVHSGAGALPHAERRAPFERRSSMTPM